ncbi:hypothetical protein [Neorhizobium petrolearium]|uniref:hypothetical protein n=1 Tax=Neorhizobium petrolearium TaxID=515361 RepID=UPI003F13D8B2
MNGLTICCAMLLWLGPSLAAAQPACDDKAVSNGIEWIRKNNATAYSKIKNGCATLSGTIGTGLGLTVVMEGYKDGQSHNAQAAALINSCSAIQMLRICDRSFPQ